MLTSHVVVVCKCSHVGVKNTTTAYVLVLVHTLYTYEAVTLQANYGGIPGKLPTEEAPAVDSCVTPNKRQNETEELRNADDDVSARDTNADKEVSVRDVDDQISARDVETDKAVEEVADKDDGDDAEPMEQQEGSDPAAADDEEEVTEVSHRVFNNLCTRIMLYKLSW